MSEQSGVEILDQLPEAQVAVLAALEPHERASLPLIVDVTGISPDEIGGHLEELQSSGLVCLQTEASSSTMQMSSHLTQKGRTLIKNGLPKPTSRLAKALGFPSGRRGAADG